jgi:hypothetical protein
MSQIKSTASDILLIILRNNEISRNAIFTEMSRNFALRDWVSTQLFLY